MEGLALITLDILVYYSCLVVMLHSLKVVALSRHRSVGVTRVARRVEVRRADRRHLKHGGGAAAGDVDAAGGAGLAEIGAPLPWATCSMNLAGFRFSVRVTCDNNSAIKLMYGRME